MSRNHLFNSMLWTRHHLCSIHLAAVHPNQRRRYRETRDDDHEEDVAARPEPTRVADRLRQPLLGRRGPHRAVRLGVPDLPPRAGARTGSLATQLVGWRQAPPSATTGLVP